VSALPCPRKNIAYIVISENAPRLLVGGHLEEQGDGDSKIFGRQLEEYPRRTRE
jgi:hypothetical protein